MLYSYCIIVSVCHLFKNTSIFQVILNVQGMCDLRLLMGFFFQFRRLIMKCLNKAEVMLYCVSQKKVNKILADDCLNL